MPVGQHPLFWLGVTLVSETEEEQRLRAVGGQRILLGPKHGELLGRGGRLEAFRKRGRGRRDAGNVSITFGRHGGQGDAGAARPSGAEIRGEIGRAQAMQAAAAGLAPHTRFNPVLLKPGSDRTSQLVVRGHPVGTLSAGDYIEHRDRLEIGRAHV